MKKQAQITINQKQLFKLKQIIDRNDNFLVTSHVNLEPDAIGSELAFAQILAYFKKDVHIVNNDVMPEDYYCMPGAKEIKNFRQPLRHDVAVALDCSDLRRSGKTERVINDYAQTIVNIDHHISNSYFGDCNIVLPYASSTCEIVYYLAKALEVPIDRKMAMNLYFGILTDTGSFRYSNTSPATFMVASDLLSYDIDANKMYRDIYKINSLAHARIISRLLVCAKAASESQVIYLVVNTNFGLPEPVVRDLCEHALNILRLIHNAKVFVLIRNFPGSALVRVNFRSNSSFDVDKVAREFNGGGHKQAAGATIEGELPRITKAVLEKIGKSL